MTLLFGICYTKEMKAEKQLILNKLIWYGLGACIAFFLCLLVIRFLATYGHETSLFFKALLLALICAGLGTLLYRKKHKDIFETILVFISYAASMTLFIYMGPVTLDRSLSSFVFIYAAQEKQIPADVYNETYFRPFVERRFSDGEKMNFLICHPDGFCTPTWKAKLTYHLLFPLARFTHTDASYQQFRNFVKRGNLAIKQEPKIHGN